MRSRKWNRWRWWIKQGCYSNQSRPHDAFTVHLSRCNPHFVNTVRLQSKSDIPSSAFSRAEPEPVEHQVITGRLAALCLSSLHLSLFLNFWWIITWQSLLGCESFQAAEAVGGWRIELLLPRLTQKCSADLFSTLVTSATLYQMLFWQKTFLYFFTFFFCHRKDAASSMPSRPSSAFGGAACSWLNYFLSQGKTTRHL